MILKDARIRKAGKQDMLLIYNWISDQTVRKMSFNKNKIVEAIDIVIPHAADVPIARLISKPSILKYGTQKLPPPIPSGIDNNPMIEPTTIFLGALLLISMNSLFLFENEDIPT